MRWGSGNLTIHRMARGYIEGPVASPPLIFIQRQTWTIPLITTKTTTTTTTFTTSTSTIPTATMPRHDALWLEDAEELVTDNRWFEGQGGEFDEMTVEVEEVEETEEAPTWMRAGVVASHGERVVGLQQMVARRRGEAARRREEAAQRRKEAAKLRLEMEEFERDAVERPFSLWGNGKFASGTEPTGAADERNWIRSRISGGRGRHRSKDRAIPTGLGRLRRGPLLGLRSSSA
ncbi:hypothetical protein DFS34DRAFT_59342 [Phlyctochytrium arcticum]|nr:hypothetical protein DFS34DRAFT_59342 [Phlyctochytrium arcticum]